MDLDLAALMHQERPVHDPEDLDAADILQCGDDLLFMPVIPGIDRDVPDDLPLFHADNVYSPKVTTNLAYGHGDLGKHADAVFYLCADGDAVARTRYAHGDGPFRRWL